MRDEDFKIVFPYVLRRAMKCRGFNQKTLAASSGLSEASISRYIKGHRLPTVREIYKISMALKCSTDELIIIDDAEIDRIKNIVLYNRLPWLD